MLARGVQRLPADQLMDDEDLLGASECAAAAGGAAGSADEEGFVCPCGLLLLCPGGLTCPAASRLCATAAHCGWVCNIYTTVFESPLLLYFTFQVSSRLLVRQVGTCLET